MRRKAPEELASAEYVVGNVIIDPTAKIGKGCKIGPNVAIGKLCEIGDGVRIVNSVILHRVTIKNFARVADSILGWSSTVGSWTRIENKSVIGEDVYVRVGSSL